MKLSKALLGAILLGVTVQTGVTSCTKKSNDTIKPTSGEQVNPESNNPPANQNPDPSECPACGMG